MPQTEPHSFTKMDLVHAINAELDLPFIGEDVEEALILKSIGGVLDYIPPAFWPILADSQKGINIEIVRRFANTLSEIIIANLPLPWLPASVKANVVTAILNLIIERAQSGMALPKLRDLLKG